MVAEAWVARPLQRCHGERDGTEQGSLTTDDIRSSLKTELDCLLGAIAGGVSGRVSASRSTKRRLDTHCQTTRRGDRHSRAAEPDADDGMNCARAADFSSPTASARAASHHTSGQSTVFSAAGHDSGGVHTFQCQ